MKQHGFTLIEVMIAVVILGMLAAIAYPNYTESVRRGNRADARTATQIVANEQERFFATNNTYTADMTNFSLDVAEGKGISANDHYTVTVQAGPTGIGTSYVVRAVPRSKAQLKDSKCTAFILDSTGRQASEPAGSDCW